MSPLCYTPCWSPAPEPNKVHELERQVQELKAALGSKDNVIRSLHDTIQMLESTLTTKDHEIARLANDIEKIKAFNHEWVVELDNRLRGAHISMGMPQAFIGRLQVKLKKAMREIPKKPSHVTLKEATREIPRSKRNRQDELSWCSPATVE